MKQKLKGSKIVNWHLPLGSSQLKSGFSKSLNKEHLEKRHSVVPDEDPLLNPWGSVDRWFNDEGREYLADCQLALFIHEIITPLRPQLFPAIAKDIVEDVIARAPPSVPLEKRLAEHIELLNESPMDLNSIRSKIVGIFDTKDAEVMKLELEDKNTKECNFLTNVLLLAPFWIRSPRTWDKKGKVSLLEHIFAKHAIPPFLYDVWRMGIFPHWKRGSKYICWFMLFAQGGSLKRAAGLFSWRIPGGFADFLWKAPAVNWPDLTCTIAEVMRLGGSETDIERITRNHGFVVDPTEIGADSSHFDFWCDTVRWVIVHRDELEDHECASVLVWAMHEYTEARRRGIRFSWERRRVRPTLQRSVGYLRQMEAPFAPYTWSNHGLNWVKIKGSGSWSFVELTTGEQLYAEGKELHHCVSSYAGMCAEGRAAVISLRLSGKPRVTIQIEPKTLRVVQCRGLFNRPPSDEEQQIIEQWVCECVNVVGKAEAQSDT